MKYIFSIDQFYTLLALAGIEALCVLDEEEASENLQLDEKTIIRVLTDLFADGWIQQEKGDFVLTDKCKNMIRIIQEAPYVVDIEFADGKCPRQMIYPAKKGAIVVAERVIDRGIYCVRLQQTEAPAYIDDLFRNDILPGGILKERSEAEQMETQLPEIEKELRTKAEAKIVIRRIEAETAETENRIEITNGTIFRQLHLYGKYEVFDHIYSVEEMWELLIKELRGEKV